MCKLFWLLASADCLEVGRPANHKPILWSGQLYWELYTDYWGHHCHSIWSLCWSSANPRCVSSITAQYGDQHLHHISTQTLRPPPPATINSLKFQSTIQNNNRKSRLNTGSMSVYLVDRETVAVEDPPITSQQSSSSQTNCHCLEPSSQTLSISISIWCGRHQSL